MGIKLKSVLSQASQIASPTPPGPQIGWLISFLSSISQMHRQEDFVIWRRMPFKISERWLVMRLFCSSLNISWVLIICHNKRGPRVWAVTTKGCFFFLFCNKILWKALPTFNSAHKNCFNQNVLLGRRDVAATTAILSTGSQPLAWVYF